MGIGGGVILIPVLTSFFDIEQKSAQFINLLYFVPVAICALIVHSREKRVDFKTAIFMSVGGIGGALIGSDIAARLSVSLLKRLFGVFLFFIGINQFKKQKKE